MGPEIVFGFEKEKVRRKGENEKQREEREGERRVRMEENVKTRKNDSLHIENIIQ